MKPCDLWREKLTECALGAPASAALTEHLQHCPACSAALRESQARLRKVDDGIRALVASEPAANAAKEILSSVESRVRSRRWFSPAMSAAAAFAVLVILAVSLAVVWKYEKRKDLEETLSAAASISNWKSPTQDLLHSSYDSLHKGPPRLGEYFYPVKTNASKVNHPAPLEKERQNP